MKILSILATITVGFFTSLIVPGCETKDRKSSDTTTVVQDTSTEKPKYACTVSITSAQLKDLLHTFSANNNSVKILQFELDPSNGDNMGLKVTNYDAQGTPIDAEVILPVEKTGTKIPLTDYTQVPFQFLTRGHIKCMLDIDAAHTDTPISSADIDRYASYWLSPCSYDHTDGSILYILTAANPNNLTCQAANTNVAGRSYTNPSPPAKPDCTDCDLYNGGLDLNPLVVNKKDTTQKK